MPDAASLPYSPHGLLLRALLPPVAYDPNGDRVARELTVDGLTLDRAYARAGEVLDGLNPFKSLYWLDRYEAVYGLPNECHRGDITLQERHIQLAIALLERIGLNTEFFRWLAGLCGYEITVKYYKPFVAGSRAGEYLTNGGWRYAITITCKGGEPNELLECLMLRYTPAHGIIHIQYAG